MSAIMPREKTNMSGMTESKAKAILAESRATCPKCGARLMSEDMIRKSATARVPSGEYRMLVMSGFINPTRGGNIQTFDSVCLPCGAFVSVKSTAHYLTSGDAYEIPAFGAPGFRHAVETLDARNCFFQIVDGKGETFNMDWTAIVSVKKCERDAKRDRVEVTVRVK